MPERCDVPVMPFPLGYRGLRAGRVSLPGHVYLLTAVTAYRRPLFRNVDAARQVCCCIHDAATWGDATVLCWVLMPDHWHGLVQLGQRDGLSVVMARFKAAAARQLRCNQPGLVWGRGYHDRAIRRDEDVRVVARYIVGNPIRAGLAAHVLDYPYWNCIWL
jgi:putative transposase